MNFFSQLGHNKIVLVTASAWIIAQTAKVLIGFLKEKKFNFRWFVGTGGMPSSHSAGATAMATICGLLQGFDSALFAIAFLFSLVTMFDAQGVRRAAGTQAGILNKIVDDFYVHKVVGENRLKELLGHTPFEVIIGGFLGIAIALVWYYFIFC